MASTIQRTELGINSQKFLTTQSESKQLIPSSSRINRAGSGDKLDKIISSSKIFSRTEQGTPQLNAQRILSSSQQDFPLLNSIVQDQLQPHRTTSIEQQSPIVVFSNNKGPSLNQREGQQDNLSSQIKTDFISLKGRHRRNQGGTTITPINGNDNIFITEDSKSFISMQIPNNTNNSFNSLSLLNNNNTGEINQKGKQQPLNRDACSVDFSQQKETKGTESKNISLFGRANSPNPQLVFSSAYDKAVQQLKGPSNFYFAQEKQKKLEFAEEDQYHFFDPKCKVKDLTPQQYSKIGHEASPVKRSILKITTKQNNSSRSSHNKRTNSPKEKRNNSESDLDKKSLEEDNFDKDNTLKSDPVIEASSPSHSQIQKEQSGSDLAIPFVTNRLMRQRSGIIITAENADPLLNKSLIHKINMNRKVKVLTDYEKQSYIKRSSDVNRLVEFQKRNQKFFISKVLRSIKRLGVGILSIIKLNLIEPKQVITSNLIKQSEIEMRNSHFNFQLIGLCIFLYSIIYFFENATTFDPSQTFEERVFLNENSGLVSYSGHLFIVVFCLGFFKFASGICDFSNRKKKSGFDLIFSEYRWNAKRSQLHYLAKKGKWIDQVYDNIELNEGMDLHWQINLLWIIEICLLAIYGLCLYFILDDDELLSAALRFTSDGRFLSRLIVSLVTSLLIYANTYILQLLFLCFTENDFKVYEKRKFAFTFFNSMFIIVSYQIKIMSYLNIDYKPYFLNLKKLDDHEASELNFMLILSLLVLVLIERTFIFIYSLILTQYRKCFKRQNKINQILPITTKISNIAEKQLIIPGQTTKEDNSTEQIMKTKEIINIETYSLANHLETQAKEQLSAEDKDNTNSNNTSLLRKPSECEESSEKNVSGSFYLQKNSILLIVINYITLSNAILQPSIFIIGFIINATVKVIGNCSNNKQKYYLSSLSSIQFKTLLNLSSLITVLMSLFFNFMVGFNIKIINSGSHQYLFQSEFSYLFDIERINSIVKIITLPYLLLPIIFLMSVLLLKQKNFYRRQDRMMRDCYYKLKHPAQAQQYSY